MSDAPPPLPAAPLPRQTHSRKWAYLAAASVFLLALVVPTWLAIKAWPSFCRGSARQAIQFGFYSSADMWLDRSAAWEPKNFETYLLRARRERHRDDVERFEAALAKAEELGAVPEAVTWERQLWKLERGEPLAGGPDVVALLDRYPDKTEVYEAYFRGRIKKGERGGDEAYFEAWRKINPLDPRPWVTEGMVAEAAGDTAQAMAHYHHALKLSPSIAQGSFRLAKLYLAQENPTESLKFFRQASGLLEEPHPAQFYIAKSQVALGNTEEGRKIFTILSTRSGITVDDAYHFFGEPVTLGRSGAAIEMARLELSKRDFEQAAYWLEKAVNAVPEDHETRDLYATTLRQIGKVDEAREEAAKAEATRTKSEGGDSEVRP